MRETGIGTSILLIAMGAILAFAINVQSSAIDLNTIGAILMVVGMIGLVFSFIALGSFSTWGAHPTVHTEHIEDGYVGDRTVTTPHEHRRVQTTDVVYEDDAGGAHVQRERRITRH
jgi:hypothetical protein